MSDVGRPPGSGRALLAIALVAVVLRAAVVVAPFLPAPGIWEDAAIALNLARGQGFTLDPAFGPTAVKAPAYPVLVSTVALLTEDRARFARLAGALNAVLGGLAVVVVGRLGFTLYGHRVGLAAAAVLAVLPTHLYLARVPEATNFSLVAAGGALLCLLRAGRSTRWRDWALFGAVTGVALLSNPIVAVGLAPVVLYLGWRRPARVALAGLMTLLVLTPWAVRNQRVLGRPILTKSPFWLDVYQGLLPDLIDGREGLPEDLQRDVLRKINGRSELEREAIFRDALVPWMKQHPGRVAHLALWRIGQFWCLYGQRPQLGPLPDTLLRILPHAALLGLMAVGAVRGLRSAPRPTLLLLFFLLTYTAVYALIVAANIRYHLEVAWAAAVLAGLGAAGATGVSGRTRCVTEEGRPGLPGSASP